jgi:hypothetical protein
MVIFVSMFHALIAAPGMAQLSRTTVQVLAKLCCRPRLANAVVALGCLAAVVQRGNDEEEEMRQVRCRTSDYRFVSCNVYCVYVRMHECT